MNLNRLFLLAFTASLTFACQDNNTNPEEKPIEIEPVEGYRLVWSDEFNSPEIDQNNWNYELGDGTAYGLPAGWGNNEKQWYTNKSENASIIENDGASVLAITALKNQDNTYTSAKLTTENHFDFRFGRVYIKAKLPQGQGFWSAIWMLGANKETISWPGCGEIDIVEVLGHKPNTMYSTLHYTDTDNKSGEVQGTYATNAESFSEDYHIFMFDWTPEILSFYVNDLLITSIPITDDMKEFLRNAYFIINLAVGGNWPGDPDETTIFPQSLLIDYIRVYTKVGFEIPDEPELNIAEETVGQFIEPNIADNAIQEGFTVLGNLDVISYGGGGEPTVSTSETAIDGDFSLVFNYPGGSWGGAYIEMQDSKDLSGYNYLNFSLHYPETLANAEIKLESPSSNAAIFLADYTGTEIGSGFIAYKIPLADFNELDLSELIIPFSIWNPQDANQEFVQATVLIDNLFFSEE